MDGLKIPCPHTVKKIFGCEMCCMPRLLFIDKTAESEPMSKNFMLYTKNNKKKLHSPSWQNDLALIF